MTDDRRRAEGSVIDVVMQPIIQPRYVGDAVGLSPTITLISLAFWACLLGPLGALMAGGRPGAVDVGRRRAGPAGFGPRSGALRRR